MIYGSCELPWRECRIGDLQEKKSGAVPVLVEIAMTFAVPCQLGKQMKFPVESAPGPAVKPTAR